MVPCFAYTAFVIDAFVGTIVDWEVSTSKETAFVQRPVNQACTLRALQANPLWKHYSPQRRGAAGRVSTGRRKHLDHGGVRWDAATRRYLRRRRVPGGKGRRTGHCDHRCVHQTGRSTLVRCRGTSDGRSHQERRQPKPRKPPACHGQSDPRWFRHAGGMPPISLGKHVLTQSVVVNQLRTQAEGRTATLTGTARCCIDRL